MIKPLEDIWSSISSNTKARVSDPFAGTFILSWVLCNWNNLALLFWGEGSVSKRIDDLYKYLSGSDVFAFNTIFTIPFLLTVFYLFLFPWLSLLVKSLQELVNGKLHKQAVGVDLSKVVEQEKLNKALLRSNPDKHFLEQSVQLEMDRKSEVLEQVKQRTLRFKEKAQAATAQAAEAKSKAAIFASDELKKQQQAELDRQRFSASTAEVRAALASHRFPSAYLYMSLLEGSVGRDGVHLSLKALGNTVASIFGYADFQSILDDENFNNRTLTKVEYIFYDSNVLAGDLEEIVAAENSGNEDLTSGLLYDHVVSLFEGLPLKFVTLDDLIELSGAYCESNSYDLVINSDELSGLSSESGTIFDDVEVREVESAKFDAGFVAVVGAVATGTHYRDSDIPGRDMSVSIRLKSSVLLGRYALGGLEVEGLDGKLDSYED